MEKNEAATATQSGTSSRARDYKNRWNVAQQKLAGCAATACGYGRPVKRTMPAQKASRDITQTGDMTAAISIVAIFASLKVRVTRMRHNVRTPREE
jgi:hypothetical protein